MSIIEVQFQKLIDFSKRKKSMSINMNDVVLKLNKLSESLDWDIKSSININTKLSGISRDIKIYAGVLSEMSAYLIKAQQEYIKCEDELAENNKADDHNKLPSLSNMLSYNPKEYSKDVETMQKRLNELGYVGADGKSLEIDGRFGNNTLNAINEFKKNNKLANDGDYKGKIGNTSWPVLFSAGAALAKASIHNTVSEDNCNTAQNCSELHVSDKLVSFIASYEGFSKMPMRGQDDGNLTVGYGHVIQKGEDFSKGISQEDAMELLKKQIEEEYAPSVIQWASKSKVKLTQNQFDALVDFAYNAGKNALPKSSVGKDILNGDILPDKIREDFDLWHKVWVESRKKYIDSSGVWRRRMDEADMFNDGDYKRDYPTAPPGYK